MMSWPIKINTVKTEAKMHALTKFKPLNASPTKWSNTFNPFVSNLSTNYLSVFDHFLGLSLKVLIQIYNF